MRFWALVFIVVGLVVITPRAKAQVQLPGTNFTLIPVNGGTGGLVSVPIPGGSGLSVTVGTGSAALPLQEIKNNLNSVNITTSDDWYNEVPLGFTFPFYGQNFTTSWAMTNGLVTFRNPQTSGLGGACCEGVDLRNTTDSRYNYTIYGLHTDLYSWNGQNQYYLRGNNEMTYGWYGISQCCGAQGGNSFEIKINSSGLVDTRIAGAMINWNRVTSGMAGDLSKGEYFQAYHGQGINISSGSTAIFSWQALGGTGAADLCLTNPLSSPSCPGYAAAYLSQQCTVSALYNPSCPGYATAYFTQQCTLNTLFDVNCPGYATAYLDYQCSINALYSTTCSGYATAYHDQQCSINPLYSTTCSGYAAAFKTQQCTANPLYATDCPGYAQAYFDQQCSLNGLYDQRCPNYATAYATRMLLERQTPTTSVATTSERASNTPTIPAPSSDGTMRVALVSDSNVNNVITSTSTSTAPTTPAAPVQLSAPAPSPNSPAGPAGAPRQEQRSEERKDDASKGTGGNSPSQNTNNSTASSDSKPAAPTARQALQERRQAAARAEAVEKGKNLANEMGKAADMESQKAVQNVVIQAMGFTPGFDAYGKAVVPDAVGYRPFTVYNNQRTIDNRSALRMFGGSDNVHRQMVDSQYGR